MEYPNFTRATFDNDDVANATNPSAFGYHHGPVDKKNLWFPDSVEPGKARANHVKSPPNTPHLLSSVNGLICYQDVGNGVMCGKVFTDQPALIMHMRNVHPGGIQTRDKPNISPEENVAGTNALKKWVLSGGWRSAQFFYEPRVGSVHSVIDTYASALTHIAANDPEFAERFGTEFHRKKAKDAPDSSKGMRHHLAYPIELPDAGASASGPSVASSPEPGPATSLSLASYSGTCDQKQRKTEKPVLPKASNDNKESEEDDEDDEDGDEEDDEDDEPRLKYARLTQHLAAVYRNGDATSAFLVAGDKMIVGTHNGNIHVFQLPTFHPLRVYHAHSASVTAISISPFPPPLPDLEAEQLSKIVAESAANKPRPSSRHQDSLTQASPKKYREPPAILNIPSNNIYIATASVDGNVCIQSLVDSRDVQLRSFGRPVQALALSPEYRYDRTYLSGGLAGSLVLTVGGQSGRSTSTTVGTATATASGWLGSMGLGTNTGKDTVLHSGEGTIGTIKWSLSGKYAVWLNEHGIKIMRTRIGLENTETESAWKRIGHIDRPQSEEWDTMASVWRGRAEWIDEQTLDPDDDMAYEQNHVSSPAAELLAAQQTSDRLSTERLVVGWGSTIWIIHVHRGRIGVGNNSGERSAGRAEIVKILRMDCIISGVSLYTQNLLLVLAYALPESQQSKEGLAKTQHTAVHRQSRPDEPAGGIRRRQNNQPPELRLIDLTTQAEVDKDALSVSRFERLSVVDYHLGILPAQTAAAAAVSSKGTLEAIAGFGADMWNAAINPKTLFSSGASIKSRNSNDGISSARSTKTTSVTRSPMASSQKAHPSMLKAGVKIFIQSPYDCILATRRDLADHLSWLLEHQHYQKAWELVDENPDILSTGDMLPEPITSTSEVGRASDQNISFEDSLVEAFSRRSNSPAEREKRRIGELWIKEIVDAGDWEQAGEVAGKVLRTSDRWEKWIWTFAGADKFDEITNFIPTEPLTPPIPRTIYEVVLGHYLKTDKPRFRELLERWPTDLFDINTIVTALENQLNFRDVREDTTEDGERGRDWRIVLESLAKLHDSNGRHREALKCYIKLQDADSAFRLIRDNHLADAVIDDIPSFITLRVPPGVADQMTSPELEESTAEAITLLVDEAQHGLVQPNTVVAQLQENDLNLYTFFYLRALWNGAGINEHQGESHDRLILESKAQVDGFADLAVHLFAMFDRSLLMDFFKSSTSYSFEKAAIECEKANYIDELVFLYSKTGQMKRALYLIIDRLGDVSRAIAFAKEQEDPDLWEDLLNYSMDKPRFIRGLLEEVGTVIDPITLVRRIPEGLEIDGLRDGLKHIMKEHEIQYSISLGVARVLRTEVSTAQATLRKGQRKGIKFEVVVPAYGQVEGLVEAQVYQTVDIQTANDTGGANWDSASQRASPELTATQNNIAPKLGSIREWQPGHCARCFEAFTEWDAEALVGFTCGHVFHLAHLLGLNSGALHSIGLGMDNDARSRRHITATKTTHARLLKDRFVGGCPVCLKTANP